MEGMKYTTMEDQPIWGLDQEEGDDHIESKYRIKMFCFT